MAYSTGFASSFADLRSALFSAVSASGWAVSGNIISKGDCFFEITSQATGINIYGGTGASGGLLTGKSTYKCCLGGRFVTLPLSYEIFTSSNPSEVYLVINYNSDFYQQLSFGESSVGGNEGAPWFTASLNGNYGLSGSELSGIFLNAYDNYSQIEAFPVNYTANAVGLFIRANWAGENGSSFAYIKAGTTPGWYGYSSGPASKYLVVGSASLVSGLLSCSPNMMNGSTTLLPIKSTVDMGSNGRATVVNLNRARLCRIDNVNPGQIITYGPDQWKVYPWLRKNADLRWGIEYNYPNNDHSGTFGYAIKYDGP